MLSSRKWCGREDSNFHGLPHSDLNAARLPIPPRPHITSTSRGDSKSQTSCEVGICNRIDKGDSGHFETFQTGANICPHANVLESPCLGEYDDKARNHPNSAENRQSSRLGCVRRADSLSGGGALYGRAGRRYPGRSRQ